MHAAETRDRQHILKSCTKIEALHQIGYSKSMYVEVKCFTRKFTPRLNMIKDKNGKTESEQILSWWKEYCSLLYTDPKGEENQITSSEKPENRELVPLMSETEMVMEALKRGK